MNITDRAENLMRQQTEKNGAPVWQLTLKAVAKGRELAKKYAVDEEVVELALWLAHTCFSEKVGDETQKNHSELSAEFAEENLRKWGYSEEKISQVTEAIRSHHKLGNDYGLLAEVMKNAECYKFLSWDGMKLYYNDLLRRGYSAEEADKFVRTKYDQKRSFLTFPECIADAEKGYVEIDRELKKLGGK